MQIKITKDGRTRSVQLPNNSSLENVVVEIQHMLRVYYPCGMSGRSLNISCNTSIAAQAEENYDWTRTPPAVVLSGRGGLGMYDSNGTTSPSVPRPAASRLRAGVIPDYSEHAREEIEVSAPVEAIETAF